MSGLAGIGLAARLSGAGRVFKLIPTWAYVAFGIALAAFLGVLYHQHRIHQHDAALVKATIAAEDQRIAAKALAIKKAADTLNTNISTLIRSKNDETNRAIIADAGDLRVSGPGKAACLGRASLPAPASRSVPASGDGNAAGPQVPSGDSAAVPWGWLTDRAEEHDLNRAEVLSWREWYQRMIASWPKAH
jgi:hypothetical protein